MTGDNGMKFHKMSCKQLWTARQRIHCCPIVPPLALSRHSAAIPRVVSPVQLVMKFFSWILFATFQQCSLNNLHSESSNQRASKRESEREKANEKEREKTKRKTNVASAVLGYAAPLKLVPRQFTCRAAAAAAFICHAPSLPLSTARTNGREFSGHAASFSVSSCKSVSLFKSRVIVFPACEIS